MRTTGTMRRPAIGVPARWRRRLTRHRRWIAAASAAAAVSATVHTLAPPAPATEPVPVAAHDLAVGQVLGPADLVTAAWPKGARPDGVIATPMGRVLSTAVRRGEPVTDARVTGPGLLAGQPAGTVAVTVRLTDPATTVLLAPGRRIDVLGGAITGTGEATGEAEVLAADVLVLTVPRRAAEDSAGGWLDTGAGPAGWAGTGAGEVPGGGSATADESPGTGAGIVVVAVSRITAARLAAAAGARSISVVLTG